MTPDECRRGHSCSAGTIPIWVIFLMDCTTRRVAESAESIRPIRMRPLAAFRLFLFGFVFALRTATAAAGASATADFDLCVRGTTLDETRTLHLKLKVDGVDVAAFAPQLGAA